VPSFLLLLVFYLVNKHRSDASILSRKNQELIKKIEALHNVINRHEKEWMNLINILSCVILVVDNKGRITRVINNLFPCQISVGNNIFEIFPSENLPGMRKAVAEAFTRAQTTRFTLKMAKAIDNSVLWYDAIVTPIKRFEDVVAVDIVFNDCTQYRSTQREKEKLILQLEKQKKELEQFSLSITHDLKSPLITINGFVGMLRKDLAAQNQAQVEKDLFHITVATQRMQSLLDDLIKISQIGKLDYTYMDIPLADVVHDAIHLVEGRIKAQKVSVNVLPGLPIVSIDRRRIVEVFQNLLDNAIKYMGPQSTPVIEIGSKKRHGENVCYVKDNGMGVDYRHQERIFTLFEKLDHGSEGTGLGLAVVKRIIEEHNGVVWVESEGKGKGSTFCFILPEPQTHAVET
jgi:signal transduction histidine kinase